MFFERLAQKRRSVLFTWLISYILVLLIPLIFSIIVYQKTEGIVNNEIYTANEAVLKQVRQTIDSRLEDIQTLSTHIALNNNLKSFMNKKPPFQDSVYYQIYNTIQDFIILRVLNNFIDSFYIYLKSTNTVLYYNQHVDSMIFYDAYCGSKNMTYKQWIYLLGRIHNKHYISTERKDNYGKYYKCLAYVQSLPIGEPHKAAATLVVMVDERKLTEIIKNMQWIKNGIGLILDKDGHLVVSTAKIDLPGILQYCNFKAEWNGIRMAEW